MSSTYENPKQINYRWNDFLQTQKTGNDRILSFSENSRKNRYEKKSQGTLYDEINSYNNKTENFQQSVTELSEKTSGYGNFDDNVRRTFQGESDALFRAARELDAGNITHEQYRKIENDAFARLNTFKASLPSLLEQATEWQDAIGIEPGNYGAVSSTTPTESQIVLNQLAKKGNVELNFDGNNPILFTPGEEKGTGSMLNLSAVYADHQKGKDFVHIIDDYSKTLTGAYDNVFQPKTGKSRFIETVYEDDPNDPGYEVAIQTITKDGRDQGIEAMIQYGQFDALVANNRLMKMVWQDQIPDELTGDDTWGATDPDKSAEENEKFLANQREVATRWLAEKAFDDNATMYQVGKRGAKRKKKPEYVPPGPGQEGNAPVEIDDVTTLMVDINENPEANSSKLVGMALPGGGTITQVDINEKGELMIQTGRQVLEQKEIIENGEKKIIEEAKNVNQNVITIDPNNIDQLLNWGSQMHKTKYGGDAKSEAENKLMPENFKKLKAERDRIRKFNEAVFNVNQDNDYAMWAKSNPLPPELTDAWKKQVAADPQYKAAVKQFEKDEDEAKFFKTIAPIEKTIHQLLVKQRNEEQAEKELDNLQASSSNSKKSYKPFSFKYTK